MKQSFTDFAVCGGVPEFTAPLVVGRPNELPRESFLAKVEAVLDSGHLTNGGPMVAEFERQIAEWLDVKHVVAVCNGTAALQIMIMACNLSGEVIIPSMTFIATAHALQWIGLTPVFADIDPETHTLQPDSVERCITQRTSAILGVHLWGNPCDVDELSLLAHQHDLKLLFDASHGFGCSYGMRPIGSLGDAEAFSFHATKVMHSVEGGAVVTNNDTIAERCRLMRNFGITGLTQIESLGINAKMSELSAAAGLTSLETVPQLIRHNANNLALYQLHLQHINGLTVCLPSEKHSSNGNYVVIRVDENRFGLSRDEIVLILRTEGVFARAYFSPGCHNAPPYAGNPIHTPVKLQTTEGLLTTIMQLPTGGTVNELEIKRISELLTSIKQQAPHLRQIIQAPNANRHPLDNSAGSKTLVHEPHSTDQLVTRHLAHRVLSTTAQ